MYIMCFLLCSGKDLLHTIFEELTHCIIFCVYFRTRFLEPVFSYLFCFASGAWDTLDVCDRCEQAITAGSLSSFSSLTNFAYILWGPVSN